ncbi:MAG: hypothetical protein ACYC7L_06645 [Nitrospirota bacterium]
MTLQEEEKKLRRLRLVVDLNQAVLMQADLTLREAFAIMNNTKKAALALFPDKETVYDLVYAPRLLRIIRERFVLPGGMMPK